MTYDSVQTLIRFVCKKVNAFLIFFLLHRLHQFDSNRFHFSHSQRINTSFVCTHFDLHYNALRVHAHTRNHTGVSMPNTKCLSLRARNNRRDQTFLCECCRDTVLCFFGVGQIDELMVCTQHTCVCARVI